MHHPLSPCRGRNTAQTTPSSLLGCSCGPFVCRAAGHTGLLCVHTCETYECCAHITTRAGHGEPRCEKASGCPDPTSFPPSPASFGTSSVALWPAPAKLPTPQYFIMKIFKQLEKLKELYSEYLHTHPYYLQKILPKYTVYLLHHLSTHLSIRRRPF